MPYEASIIPIALHDPLKFIYIFMDVRLICSVSGPQKIHWFPAMSNEVISHKLGSLRANLWGFMTGADQAKSQSALIDILGNEMVCQSRKRDFHQSKSWITVAMPN